MKVEKFNVDFIPQIMREFANIDEHILRRALVGNADAMRQLLHILRSHSFFTIQRDTMRNDTWREYYHIQLTEDDLRLLLQVWKHQKEQGE
jgi:hypothetical protein